MEQNETHARVLGDERSEQRQDNLAEQIEELRRRAKDNKAHNTELFIVQSFSSLEHIRNLLLTLSVAGIGLLRTDIIHTFNQNAGYALLWSIIIGIISYTFHYLSLLSEAHYYSDKEILFSTAFPTMEQYKIMLEDELKLSKNGANILRFFGFIFLIFQSCAVIAALFIQLQ